MYCPYDVELCKHLAAVFFYLNSGKKVKSVYSLRKKLLSNSKEDLIKMIERMIETDPKLSINLLSEEMQLKERIAHIEDKPENGWHEYYDYIPDRVEELIDELRKHPKRRSLLLLLKKKIVNLNKKYGDHGSIVDSVEYISEELKLKK